MKWYDRRLLAAWAIIGFTTVGLYVREGEGIHFLWHFGYGGAFGVFLGTMLQRFEKRLPWSGWALAGYVFMIVPDIIWFLPSLVGNGHHAHEPWMNLFLGHVSLDEWQWATPFLPIMVGLTALFHYVGFPQDARRKERVGVVVSESKLLARPLLMPALSVGGFWLGAYQLSIAPWHHLTFIWVGGLGAGLYGAYQTYRCWADRVCLARWLDGADDDAAAVLEDAETWAGRLPASYRLGFHERRRNLRRLNLVEPDA